MKPKHATPQVPPPSAPRRNGGTNPPGPGQLDVLEAALRQAAGGIVACDKKGWITFANEEARRHAMSDPNGTRLSEGPRIWGTAFQPDGAELTADRWPLAEALRGVTTQGREIRVERADGVAYDLLITAAPMRDSRNRILGAVATFTDITERKRAELALKASEERFRLLVQGVTDFAILMLDAEGRVISWNEGAEWIKGYTADEIMGHHFSRFFPTEEAKRGLPAQQLQKAADLGRVESEGWRLRKDGSRFWASTVITALRDERGRLRGFAKVTRDITARKGYEDAIRRLSGDLIRLRDQEQRRIGRELHDSTAQLLAALEMNLEAVRRSAQRLDPRARRALSRALRLSRQSSLEIRSLSFLLHPPMLDEMGLLPAVREYVSGFAQRSGIRVQMRLPRHLERLEPEAEVAIFRVIQEALTNVQRHSGSRRASVLLATRPEGVTLEVSDGGRGLANPVTGKSTRGVGLASMEERVRQLDGRFEIRSGNVGTRLRALIPWPHPKV